MQRQCSASRSATQRHRLEAHHPTQRLADRPCALHEPRWPFKPNIACGLEERRRVRIEVGYHAWLRHAWFKRCALPPAPGTRVALEARNTSRATPWPPSNPNATVVSKSPRTGKEEGEAYDVNGILHQAAYSSRGGLWHIGCCRLRERR